MNQNIEPGNAPRLRAETKWRNLTKGILLLISISCPWATALVGQETDEEIIDLSPFQVTADEDVHYRAVDTVSGTRMRVPLREIPLPIQALTSALIEDTASYNVSDAINYAASVRRQGSSTNDFDESFSIRGFIAGFNLRNGFRTQGVTDTANIERIEVLKGPSSVLYGAAEPGGLLNFITKRPRFDAGGSFSYTYGSYDLSRGVIDVYGPLGSSSEDRFAYRFVSSYHKEGSKTFWDLDKLFVAPSVLWQVTPKISLRLELEYTDRRQDGLRKRGMVTLRRGVDIPGYELPQDIWDKSVGPDYDVQKHSFKNGKQLNGILDLQVDATDWLTYRFIYFDASDQIEVFKIDGAENPTMSDGEDPVRGARRLEEENNDFSYKHDFLIDLDLEDFGHHQIVFGYEVLRQNFMETVYRHPSGVLPPIDLSYDDLRDIEKVRQATDNFSIDHLYGATWDTAVNLPLTDDGTEGEKMDSYFLTDKITAMDERLHLLLGVRYDEISDGVSVDRTEDPPEFERAPDESETTFQTGALYQLTDIFGLFVNYSTAFQPNGFGAQGEVLPPQTGTGIDLGVKLTGLLGGRLYGNVAAFEIVREDIPRTISIPPDFIEEETLLSGKERTRGIDFDFTLDLMPGWQLMVAGAYMDGVIVDNEDDPLLEGTRNVEAPRKQLRVFTNYSFNDGALAGLSIGGGVHYEDETPTENRSTRFLRRTDEAAIFDLFARYRFNVYNERPAEISINIKNVTDKVYLTRSQQWGEYARASISFKMEL